VADGIITESHIIGYLSRIGYELKESENYDHTYKLDFIINGFKNIDKLFQIGCQVTTKLGDAHKMKLFYEVQVKTQVVPKAAYVEITPEVDIKAGVGELIHAALLNYVFNGVYDKSPVIGITLERNGYKYFDVKARAEKLLMATPKEEPIKSPLALELEKTCLVKPQQKPRMYYGKVYSYIQDRGYGYIIPNGKDFETDVFFHINNVKDEKLNIFLQNYTDFRNATCLDHEGIVVQFSITKYKGQEQAVITDAQFGKMESVHAS
jgi:cold shock CspA family protein